MSFSLVARAQGMQHDKVSVNSVDALSVQAPFGGMKQSGFGRVITQP
ncbi:MAG: hypothetical protein ACR2O3_06345 [Rhizobiaceae bacterium]